MHMFNHWVLAIRPKTLPASISPVLLGSALAIHEGQFDYLVFTLTLVCALMLQIAVNLANDLFDAKSGVDSEHRLGPVRVTQSGLVTPAALKTGLLLASLAAAVSGVALAYLSSWLLLVFGIGALLAVFAYSGGPWPLASHALGEVTVFFSFGWLAVGGAYFVQTLTLDMRALGFGTVAGLFSAAIMLVNNIRDIPTDVLANKRTLAVVLGDKSARQLYKALLVASIIAHLVVTIPYGLYSFLPLLLVAPLTHRLIGNIVVRQGRTLNKQLAQTAELELAYCVLTGLLLLFI